MEKRTNLVWIDLEMTGLNPEIDYILEIAVIITDKDLNIVAEGPDLVLHYDKLLEMDEWVQKTHTNNGLLAKVKESDISLQEAEDKVLTFITEYTEKGCNVLSGNSIWQDKRFLQKYMPRVISWLHYRLIDVSTIKELVKMWYPNDPNTDFKKSDNHRALEDIKESIEELKHYRNNFFRKNHEK